MTNERLSALITGASSGIGAVYADRLARRGHDLVLVARRVDRLTDLASKLRDTYGITAEVLPADLSIEMGIGSVEERLREAPPIDLLVNNAGIPSNSPIVSSSGDQIDRLIDVNVRAVARLAAAAASMMKTRGTGSIVNIASVIGLMHEAGLGFYGPTKSFVIAMSQNLQAELAPSDVYVQAVLPAATRTEIWTVSGRDRNEAVGLMEVDDLVDAALAGFDQREAVTIPSLPDVELWRAYEARRHELVDDVRHERPADRYIADAIAL
jgi:uncharacterized protein